MNPLGPLITGEPSATDHCHIPKHFRLSTYQYPLPRELIAQEPAAVRDESRLLVIRRNSGEMACRVFRDLPELLGPSDLLVFNETRVVPASLRCRKPSGGLVELLVLDPAYANGSNQSDERAVRVCMARSSKSLRVSSVIAVENGPDLTVERIVGPGRVEIRFPVPEESVLSFLDRYGSAPLPPYIKPVAREEDRDRSRYQTVYAKKPGSIAAPTAGLHFTEELLGRLNSRGIESARVVLHVGSGTFSPIREEDIRLHRMETEVYQIPEKTAQQITRGQQDGRRILAVGTTTARALESSADQEGRVSPGLGRTDLFITPGYEFRVVQGMITNFHLPGSTLVLLVCALAGTETVLHAYEKAILERFRFYSYGDACLIID